MTRAEKELGDEKTALKSSDHEESSTIPTEANSSLKTKDSLSVAFVNGSERSADDLIIDVRGKDDDGFVGLKKEDLQKFASDPYWVRLRIIFLVLFAVIWVAMLVAAIVIIVVAPKCPPRPDQEWWEAAVIYQLNPNSFLDANGDDGKGDLKGIEKKLGYIKDLKVTALNLGPIYPSPRKDFGYDIYDFKRVCDHYGTLDDFVELLVALHKQGMKLILDFIPNHTSLKHNWFVESRNNSDSSNKFRDFYIWRPAGQNGTPPNNWLNVYGEPAWTLDDARNEYYYHSYSKDEPDLNLRNQDVVRLLDDALNFWLEKEVDGFRLIGAEHFFEPEGLEVDNTKVQPETYELIGRWRELMNNFSFSEKIRKSRRFSRLLIVDIDETANKSVEFFNHNGRPGAHLPTNKVLQRLTKPSSANEVYSLLNEWSEVIRSISKIANWQVGDYNTSRVVTRMGGKDYLNAINMLLLTLPGTAMVYNGDELGMKDVVLEANGSYSFSQNLIPRAGQHSPMQWSDKLQAGFTSGTPWIPIAEGYAETNIEAETAHGSGTSHVKVFQSLAALKQEPSFRWGQFSVAVNKSVVFYVRQAEGFAGYLVAINFGPQASTVNFRESHLKDMLPEEGEIVATTHNFGEAGRHENYRQKAVINLGTAVYLKRTEGIVLKWEPKTSFF